MKSNKSLSYEALLETFKSILRSNHLKFTAQREAILRTLYEHPDHFTPENLYLLVKEKYPDLNTGITTVYRTLNLLEENKLVTSLSFGTQGKKFELGNKPHHDHMICEVCGSIIEFEDPKIEALQQAIAKAHGFKLTNHLMQLYGICKKCQEKE
ncbi:MAG TPA: transcriptional repressor [Campylobacteraceae bacterium]|jgi:Fur family ferric uptake transcriptional regulator|nr:transcriptional repressor [Campylobacteraceae bacterium]